VRPSLEVDEALWERIVDTNLKGAFFCAQAAARAMAASKQPGSIINLCSLTSYVGVPTAAPYGSSKSGLLGMTRALAAEWASLGIRVNAIAPGYFRTDMTEVFYQGCCLGERHAAEDPAAAVRAHGGPRRDHPVPRRRRLRLRDRPLHPGRRRLPRVDLKEDCPNRLYMLVYTSWGC
jgi:NAD(P)-dependent dehydrogenase (short-subunit alcohol dehydrogenase family)